MTKQDEKHPVYRCDACGWEFAVVGEFDGTHAIPDPHAMEICPSKAEPVPAPAG